LTSGLDGTYNLILDQNGRLIAHPRFMEAILAIGGALPLQEAGDAHLQRIYHLARHRGASQVMVLRQDGPRRPDSCLYLGLPAQGSGSSRQLASAWACATYLGPCLWRKRACASKREGV
jgi:hypothetical protein